MKGLILDMLQMMKDKFKAQYRILEALHDNNQSDGGYYSNMEECKEIIDKINELELFVAQFDYF